MGCSGQLEGKFREEGFEKVGELVEAGVVDKDLKELGVKKLKARKTLLRGGGGEGGSVAACALIEHFI